MYNTKSFYNKKSKKSNKHRQKHYQKLKSKNNKTLKKKIFLSINKAFPTYKYLIKQEFLEDKIPLTSTKKIDVFDNEFIKRGNWVKFDEKNSKEKIIDFLYTDGKYLVDKSLYKYKKRLTTFVNMADDNHSISDKYNLIENLKKTSIDRKHLLDQHYINMYDIYKNTSLLENYKPFFDKYKVLIFKPIHGLKGENIHVFDEFDKFSKFINEFLEKNDDKLRRLITGKYNELGIVSKYNQYNIEWVLQEYIINPLLFRNLKFHLRGYFIYYKSLNNEKKGYILDDMTFFTAKNQYNLNDFTNKDIHDTHHKSTIEGISFKNNIMEIANQEQSKYIMDQIVHIFKNVLKVINASCYPESQNCFNIFGFDVMIMDDYTVKIIETNFMPGSPRIEVLQNVMTEIVDQLFPPKNKLSKLNNLIKL